MGACHPRNFLDFRPSEIVAGAIWGRNTRPYGRHTCCAMPLKWLAMSRTRYYASYFRTRPSIITLTAFLPSQGPPTRASTSYPSQRRGCFYYTYSQVSAPPSGTVGSKGGSSAPNEQQGPQKARRQLPPLPLC